MSTLEANKALVERFVEEFWSKGNPTAAVELMTPDVIIQAPGASDLAGLRALNTAVRSAFPDWYSTPEELVAEGDRVAERWTGRGTHRGDLQGIAPTGRQVAVPGVVFYRIRDGKISEFRGSWDELGLLQQLGVAPVPAPVAH